MDVFMLNSRNSTSNHLGGTKKDAKDSSLYMTSRYTIYTSQVVKYRAALRCVL